MKISGEIKFYGLNTCPFSQRAWIGLVKAGIPFKYVEMDPKENRENLEWLKINPKQKVPVLTIDDKGHVIKIEY